MFYPCSENKGADQLRSYCEADLRLCFLSRMQIVGFPMRGLIYKRHSNLQSLVSIMLRSDRRNISDVKDMPAEKDVVHMLEFYREDVLIFDEIHHI